MILFHFIFSPQVKKAWEQARTVEQNLNDMGLAYDSNKTLKIPSTKELLQPMECDEETSNCDEELSVPRKNYVAKELEDDAKAPRVKNFRLPNNQVTLLTYFMDKYGEDYKVCFISVYISQHSKCFGLFHLGAVTCNYTQWQTSDTAKSAQSSHFLINCPEIKK